MIQFLVNNDIITVPNQQVDDSETVKNLKTELVKIKRESTRDIKNAFNDGYEKGISENRPTNTKNYTCEDFQEAIPDCGYRLSPEDRPKNYTCEDSIDAYLLYGFAKLGIIESAEYIPDDASPSTLYWLNQLTHYQEKYNSDLSQYPNYCPSTPNHDERYTLSLIDFLQDFELTTEELCDEISADNETFLECYDLFQPIE